MTTCTCRKGKADPTCMRHGHSVASLGLQLTLDKDCAALVDASPPPAPQEPRSAQLTELPPGEFEDIFRGPH